MAKLEMLVPPISRRIFSWPRAGNAHPDPTPPWHLSSGYRGNPTVRRGPPWHFWLVPKSPWCLIDSNANPQATANIKNAIECQSVREALHYASTLSAVWFQRLLGGLVWPGEFPQGDFVPSIWSWLPRAHLFATLERM
jgi:hypothetical protein